MALLSLFTRRSLRTALLAATFVASASSAHAQSAFTYQGQLKSAGAPYNGTADVRFTLYTAVSGGSIVGAPVDVINTTITNGLVSASVNFGALAFDGSPRWLEVAVRTPSNGGAGPFTTLTPRQSITAAPYAVYALNNNSPFTLNGANAVFSGAGNVGVGTTTPTGGKFVVQTATGNYGMVHSDGTNTIGTWVGTGSNASGGWLGTTSNSALNFFTASSAAQMSLTTAGNLGLGNATPDGRLHLTGGPTWTSNAWTKSLTLDAAAAIELGKGNLWKFGLGSSQNGFYLFKTTIDNTSLPAQYIMGIDSNGHVGFNSNGATSGAPLWVAGTATGEWTFYSTSTGQDGFGIVSVSSGLNGRGIEGQCAANGYAATVGSHGSGAYGLLGTQNEGVYGNGGPNGKHGMTGVALGAGDGMLGAYVGTSTSTAGVFGYSTASAGNGIIGEANTGTSAYGVWGRAAQGIGGFFSGGQYAIYANGKARCSTIEIAGGSDLAEPFDVAQIDDEGSMRDIEPGMVVVIDPANPGALMIATQANDRKVAGIISGANDLAPGMVMKSEGSLHVDGDHPVALTGRVWCWCDASTIAIEPGDMLTTSTTPGHAMKVTDFTSSQGAIIGKAMTPLASGERGLVLVLVNLQ